eukprot:gene14993-biopygen18669
MRARAMASVVAPVHSPLFQLHVLVCFVQMQTTVGGCQADCGVGPGRNCSARVRSASVSLNPIVRSASGPCPLSLLLSPGSPAAIHRKGLGRVHHPHIIPDITPDITPAVVCGQQDVEWITSEVVQRMLTSTAEGDVG